MPITGRWTVVIVAVALVGCAPFRGRTEPADACRPVREPLPAGASTAGMAGAYQITMVATDGRRAGHAVSGQLELTAQDSALLSVDGVAQPFRGTADIALDSVGAVRMGDLAAADPSAPGVAVYEQRASSGGLTVLVRLGSASNARGPQPFDAGHTTFYVRRITAAGFAGGWGSSAGSTYPFREAQGYFCAVRSRS